MPLISRLASSAARGFGLFSAVARAVDPFFNYVTALLHGDGTNGAQNNTFLDSSTNNFTITRNGNTTQGTFSPFSQTGWSNYFTAASSGLYNATGSSSSIHPAASFLSAASGSRVGSIEAMVYVTAYPSAPSSGEFGAVLNFGGNYFCFGVNSGGELSLYYYSGSAAYTESTVANAVPLNQWTYVAAIFDSSNNVKLYVNGALLKTATFNGVGYASGNNTMNQLRVGRTYTGSTSVLQGYISNFRLVNGTAVTPSTPTTPFTAITNTSLLTCQSNRFIDNSSNAYALTIEGTPSVQAFSPFNPTSAWSASSNGGSGYFDGSGDYLITTSTQVIPTGSFTVEAWAYPTSSPNQTGVVAQGSTGNAGRFSLCVENNLWFTQIGSTVINTGTPILNAWTHLAVTFNGSTLTFYINGISVGTAATSTNVQNTTLRIGSLGPTDWVAYYWPGYISQVRVSNTVRTISVPTAPYSSDGNTTFLASYTNAGIYDNAAVADYETLGNAQVSTSVVKYGTGSMAFDGTGDYLSGPTNANFAFGTGDFTVEGWVYFNSVSGTPTIYSSGTYNTSQFTLRVSSSKFQFYGGNGATLLVSGSTTLTTSVWYHFAVCRIAGVTKLFVNGNTDVTDSTAFTYSPTGSFSVGETIGNTGQLNGYIDDLRITKGVGRYQYNFTPPTAAFPNIGGTVTPTSDQYFRYTTLLLPGNGTNGAQNNTFLDSSSNAFTITRNGNTTQGNFSPFSQTGWSNYFTGGARVISSANTALSMGTGDFTWECWVNIPAASGYQAFIDSRTTAYTDGLFIGLTTGALTISMVTNVVLLTSSTSIQTNQWNHIALVRSSGTATIYLNGTNVGSVANSTNLSNNVITIADFVSTGNPTTGYISNVRITKGAALYTANFTPSTTPLTTTVSAGTVSLLTCQSNRFVDNSVNAFALTVAGSPSVQAFSPFAPTAAWSASTNGGSGYFDGSGDYLTVAANAALGMGTGDFTVELWFYYTAAPSNEFLFDFRYGGGSLLAAAAGTFGVDVYVGAGQRTGGTVVANNWYHLAVTRSGSTCYVFLNGAQVGATFTDSTNLATGGVSIASRFNVPTQVFPGYISNFRVVKGTAVYTASFTPPTAPLTAITNTQLLLSATNGGIVDATAKNDLETVGNAQISTTQSKFGGSSMYFDGTGDWLTIPANVQSQFGTGDMTIELWIKTADTKFCIYDNDYQNSGTYNTMGLYYESGQIAWTYGPAGGAGADLIRVTNSTLIDNSWHHLAVTRYGTTTRMFLDGIQIGSGTNSTNFNSPNGIYIGQFKNFPTYDFNGYIDDLRITKGIARYTSNFTPPTSAFLLQ